MSRNKMYNMEMQIFHTLLQYCVQMEGFSSLYFLLTNQIWGVTFSIQDPQ